MTNQTIVRVSEIMKKEFVLMEGISTVKVGLEALLKEDTHTIIIKPRNENDEYGIVVLPDIAKKVLAVDKSPERINLYEIMTKPVISVKPDMDIRYCARLFHNFGLSAAPVIEDKQVIGIVTYSEMILKGMVHFVEN